MKILTSGGEVAATYGAGGWAFISDELAERAEGLSVWAQAASMEAGPNVYEEIEEVSEGDYRYAYDLAALIDGRVELNGSVQKGGEGSGHHGHAGRPGSVGGSASIPGYVARTTAMERLGVRYSSKLNQYFKYGMPSTKQGRRRYVKWPEAEEWLNEYKSAGKGKGGIAAANALMKKRGIPVGEHPPLPPPPKPGKLMPVGSAMKELGVKHYSRMHSYFGHGMPHEVDVKGKRKVKWPEAKVWYETYEKHGKGRAGIDAANEAVKKLGARTPPGGSSLPPPPKPPKSAEGKRSKLSGRIQDRDGQKISLSSRTDYLHDGSNLDTTTFKAGTKFKGFNEEFRGREYENAKHVMRKLPPEHTENVGLLVSGDKRSYGYFELHGEDVAGVHMGKRVGGNQAKSEVALNRRWTGDLSRKHEQNTLVHEIGHAVHQSWYPRQMHILGGIPKQMRARGDRLAPGTTNRNRSKAARKLNLMFDEVKEGKRKAVRRYAETNVREYFACHYAEYVTSPKSLRRRDSELYTFFKEEIFGGLEYE